MCTLIDWPHSEFHRIRRNVEAEFFAALELAAGIAQRVRCGRRVEPFYGTAHPPNDCSASVWCRLGVGRGRGTLERSDARPWHPRYIQDADLLVEAIDAGLSGRMDLLGAMAEYERARNRVAGIGRGPSIRGANGA